MGLKFLIASMLIFQYSTALNDQDWLEHKTIFGKVYTNSKEDALRKSIFEQNLKDINELLKKPMLVYRKGINQFTEMTYEELVGTYMSYKPSKILSKHYDGNDTISSEFELTKPPMKRD